MHFIFLVAAYNEAPIIETLTEKFKAFRFLNCTYEVIIINNGSTDNSETVLKNLTIENANFNYLSIKEKGLGVAFKAGLKHLSQRDHSKETWVVFTACDLPFGFTDVAAFLENKSKNKDETLYIGSKAHKNSQVQRDFKRQIMSYVFLILRILILNINVKDTQGTILMPAKYISVFDKIKSNDYFFTTELIYKLRSSVADIVELPVILYKELRPSSVRPFRDGLNACKQMLALRK